MPSDLAGLTGSDLQIALKSRAQARRAATGGDKYATMLPLPGWDEWAEAMKENQEEANANGLQYRVDWSGLGQSGDGITMPRRRTSAAPGSLGYGYGGDPEELNPLEAQSAKYQAINAASNDEAFKQRQQQAILDAQADAKRDRAIKDAQESYQQQVATSLNAPPILQTVTKNANGAYTTGDPRLRDPRTAVYDRLSPAARLEYDKQMSVMDVSQRKQTESEAASTAEIDLKKRALEETIRKNKFEEGGQDVSANVKTTLSGKPYLDLGDYQTPTAKEAARRRAQAAGIKAVNPEVGASLAAADTARQNINAMWAQIESKLPKDPTGRIVGGPKNKLAQVFQTDADLAAFNSWRAGAIQAVQALVEKGMGFRLNQAEINMIMQNDMPQITDTVQAARRRVDNVLTLLQNKENSALTQDRSSLPSGGGSGGPSGKRIRYDMNGNPIKD